MKPILVLYATREGQTQKIAQYIGDGLRDRGFNVEVINAADVPPEFELNRYDAAVLAASIHVGKHEPELIEFVKSHRSELQGLRTAFLSVSGSQAGAERPSSSPADRERCAADAQRMIDEFEAATGWTPTCAMPVAGALMYRKYNFIVRFIMRQIAKREGGSTDTSRNVEYTDWKALDRFSEAFGSEVLRAA